MNDSLNKLIIDTPFLSSGDKDFLLQKLPNLNPLERLKLQQSLSHGQAPNILQSLQVIRARFFNSEAPKKPDILSQVASAIFPKKPKKVLASNILNQSQIIGGPVPQAVKASNIQPLKSLAEFYHPFQLATLNPNHLNFGLNDSSDIIIQNFLNKVDQIFDKIENINLRRGYFMNFVQSPLFNSYLNTGLTALRHPELQPSNITLNLLYQINSSYLNNKQFKAAATICNHLRSLASL